MKTTQQLKDMGYTIPQSDIKRVLDKLQVGFDTIDWGSFSEEAKASSEVLEDEIIENYGEPSLQEETNPKLQHQIDSETVKQHYDQKQTTIIEIPRQKVTACVGDTRSGKTALCFQLIENWKGNLPVYIFNHPNESLLAEAGYKVLHTLDEIQYLSDCIVYIDEPQLYFNVSGSRGIDLLIKFLSLCGQKDISVIFSTSETRFFSKRIEAYVDLWAVKDTDYALAKQGGIIKDVIEQYSTFSPRGFRLQRDEVLMHSRKLDINRLYTFSPPPFFDDRWSKPYHSMARGKPLVRVLPGSFARVLPQGGNIGNRLRRTK